MITADINEPTLCARPAVCQPPMCQPPLCASPHCVPSTSYACSHLTFSTTPRCFEGTFTMFRPPDMRYRGITASRGSWRWRQRKLKWGESVIFPFWWLGWGISPRLDLLDAPNRDFAPWREVQGGRPVGVVPSRGCRGWWPCWWGPLLVAPTAAMS